ncbi:MAG: hypothetical protein U0176_23295 [Bacteroidia bacterium]
MFGTEIIEVGIGLVFAYFSISIICSGIVELGVKLTKLRQRHMKMALGKLLDDKHYNGFVGELYKHHLISSPFQKQLGDPTSIPARNFAIAVLDILGKNDKLSEAEQFKVIEDRILTIKDEATKLRMLNMLRSSANHFDTMRKKIENWFDESMVHVSEWYRKRMRLWVTVVSVGVVVAMNADTLNMAKLFWNDDELRTATVGAAQALVDSVGRSGAAVAPVVTTVVDTARTSDSTMTITQTVVQEKNDSVQTAQDLRAIKGNFDLLYRDINAAKVLPIGWESEIKPWNPGWDKSKSPAEWWLVKIAGLILTVGAVSLGSTYWYKQLQSLLSLRFGKPSPPATPAPDPVPPVTKAAPKTEEATEGSESSTEGQG